MKPWEVEMRVEALLKQRAAEASGGNFFSAAHRIQVALSPLATMGVFDGMTEAQVRDAVEAAVGRLKSSSNHSERR